MVALVQNQNDDDEELGAPAAKVHESKSGGIVDVLVVMKDKAESELADTVEPGGGTLCRLHRKDAGSLGTSPLWSLHHCGGNCHGGHGSCQVV